MGPFALTVALCSLAAGIAGGLALRLVPSLRLRLAGLALLASGLPLVAVVASGLIMFDTRHDALVTLVAAAASAAALVGALLVSRSIALPLQSLRRTARRLADGELEARAELSGPTELRDVAAVVNEMSTSLDGLLRAQRELVAAAGHDLRTPLTNLRAAAEALEDGVGDPAQHVAALQVQVERMTLSRGRPARPLAPGRRRRAARLSRRPSSRSCSTTASRSTPPMPARRGCSSSATAHPGCGAAAIRSSSAACSRTSSATPSATHRPAGGS